MEIIKTNTKIYSALFCAAFALASCHINRQTASNVSPPPPTAPVTNSPGLDFEFIKPPDGIHAPGDAELAAIQKQYKDANMQQLQEGHALYTTGLCTSCHSPVGIYQYDEQTWKNIVDDMASRAGMTEVQKDAVYKYVLSIKSTQPK